MESLPIFMRLQGRNVLVVGEGELARAKRRLLEAAGARVVIIPVAPARGFTAEMVSGFALVFGASGDDAVDRDVSVAARAAGIPVNVVDRPELSDFIMPAVVDRGEVVIGISTNGASPILAQRVRGWIEDALPSRLDRLAAFARHFRSAVHGRVPGNGARRRFWNRFFEGEGADLVLAGKEQQAARALIRDINGAQAALPAEGSMEEFHLTSHDPADLTLRMLRALRRADVIAHDASVPAAILEYARRDARRISRIERSDLSGGSGAGLRVVILNAAVGRAVKAARL